MTTIWSHNQVGRFSSRHVRRARSSPGGRRPRNLRLEPLEPRQLLSIGFPGGEEPHASPLLGGATSGVDPAAADSREFWRVLPPLDPAKDALTTQDESPTSGVGSHGGNVQIVEVFQGRVYYSVRFAGGPASTKVAWFDPRTNQRGELLGLAGGQFPSLKQMYGRLYVSHDSGRLWSYDGTTLSEIALPAAIADPVNHITAMAMFRGKMYFGTNDGEVWQSVDLVTFAKKTQYGGPVYDLVEWNNYLYGCNTENYSYSAKVFRTLDGDTWESQQFSVFGFQGFVATPTHLYVSSCENAGGPSFEIRATADGWTWNSIYYTNTLGKELLGRPAYFTQNGTGYFAIHWDPTTHLVPVKDGRAGTEIQLSHGYNSLVEYDGRMLGLGSLDKTVWQGSPYVVGPLGLYVPQPWTLHSPFDPGSQDSVQASDTGSHGGNVQIVEVFQGRVYYSVRFASGSTPTKVAWFDPRTNQRGELLGLAGGHFPSLKEMYGKLYLSHDSGRLWTYDGTTLTELALPADIANATNYITAMAMFKGKMYFGTADGDVWQSADAITFTKKAQFGDKSSPYKPIGINDLVEWNNHLYGCNGEQYSYSAKIFRTLDGETWESQQFGVFSFGGFLATPSHLYVASCEDASGPSFAIRATADGWTWDSIYYTNTLGKELLGRPAYFTQNGTGYFAIHWDPTTHLVPVKDGRAGTEIEVSHGYNSLVEYDGRMLGLGSLDKTVWQGSPYVVGRLGNYVATPLVGAREGDDSFVFTAAALSHEAVIGLAGVQPTAFRYPSAEPLTLSFKGLGGSDQITSTFVAAAYAAPINLTIDAGAGSDKITINGGPGKDTTVINRYYVQHTGPGATTDPGYYSVYGNNVETIIDNAGAGTGQRSTFYDGPDNGDVFTAHCQLRTGSMRSAVGNPNAYNNSSTGYDEIMGGAPNGGTGETANLYDSNGNDYFVAKAGALVNPQSYIQRVSGGTGPVAFVNAGVGFETVNGISSAGGVDEAVLFGSNGDDSMNFQPGYTSGTLIVPRAYITRPGGYFVYAQNFKKITGYPDAGNDQVAFFDTAGDDVFTASPTRAELVGPAGSNIWNVAATDLVNSTYKWDTVRAYAQVGGYDKAYLTGSTGADTFLGFGKPRTANAGLGRLSGSGYFLEVYQFEEVYANLLTGNDTAKLYDGMAATDHFWAKLGAAVLTDGTEDLNTGALVTPGTYYYKVYGFDSAVNDRVSVDGLQGGTNKKHVVNPLDYVLTMTGVWIDE